MAQRGAMTDEVKAKMEAYLGRSTSLAELRLIPYLQYVMVNDQYIDPKKINAEERGILSLLLKDGHIEGGGSGLGITREFWDFICDVMFMAYVDIDGDTRKSEGQ